jgi:hypothetical protein
MCTGNAAIPLIAAGKLQRQNERQDRRQERRRDRRQAELDAIAAKREDAMAANKAEMRDLRQQDRQAARAQESALAPAQGGSYQVQSTTAQSAQAVLGQNSGLQAPGAALSGRKGRAGRRSAAGSSLRIGPTSSAPGSGPNIAV